eukprot:CAMPEP_0170649006 /NCGR_PEP_ID=MMETSP0224-20130122/45047_1 /TAXON_ID=285029 /ORGANISM="Togula jolla, Strain CCCM 725" /LENGTH=75 /DNA_ID=CAMNT_0010980589 /DNA_START=32 /DNA_END=259 /DNA_ORIENTATION=-
MAKKRMRMEKGCSAKIEFYALSWCHGPHGSSHFPCLPLQPAENVSCKNGHGEDQWVTDAVTRFSQWVSTHVGDQQ